MLQDCCHSNIVECSEVCTLQTCLRSLALVWPAP